MDGRGRWMGNIFIEWVWRSLKYECVFLNAFETGSEARTGIGRWIAYYNTDRPHLKFDGKTPDEVFARQENEERVAVICSGIHLSLATKLARKPRLSARISSTAVKCNLYISPKKVSSSRLQSSIFGIDFEHIVADYSLSYGYRKSSMECFQSAVRCLTAWTFAIKTPLRLGPVF